MADEEHEQLPGDEVTDEQIQDKADADQPVEDATEEQDLTPRTEEQQSEDKVAEAESNEDLDTATEADVEDNASGEAAEDIEEHATTVLDVGNEDTVAGASVEKTTDEGDKPTEDISEPAKDAPDTERAAESEAVPNAEAAASVEEQKEVAAEEQIEAGTQEGLVEQTEGGTEGAEKQTEGEAERGSEEYTEAGAEKQTDAGAEEQTEAGAEQQTEAGAEEQTEAGAEEQTEAGAEQQTEAGAEEHAESSTEEQKEGGAEEQTEADVEQQTEAGAEQQTETGAEEQTEDGAEKQKEGGAEEKTEAGAEEKTEASAEDQAEVGAEEQKEVGAEEQAEVGAEEQKEVGAEEQAEAGAEAGAEDQTEVVAEEQAEVGTEEQEEGGAEKQAEAGTEEQAEAGAEVKIEAVAEEKSEAGGEEQTDAGVENTKEAGELATKEITKTVTPVTSPKGTPPVSAAPTKQKSVSPTDIQKPGTPEAASPKPDSPKHGSPKPGSPKAGSPGTHEDASCAEGALLTEATSDSQTVPTAPPPPESGEAGPSSPLDLGPGPDPLNLIWSFGLNEKVPVINITDANRKMVMYACAHTGILYDVINNTQKLLQGHSNNITCTCISEDKRWLATGDQGPDNTIIIWDTLSGFPVRTIFEAYPDGIVSIAITPNAKYLATLSACPQQVLAIWDWTTGDDAPIHTAQLDPQYGLQNYLLFNRDDSSQLVSNSDHQVIFYSWTDVKFEYFAPPLTDQDFNKPVGRFSQTIYVRDSTRALTATSLGNMVVWDSNKPITVAGTEPTPDKRALKLVKLQDSAMKVLTTTDDYIVIGDAQGHVKFLDQKLKLINWYQDFDVGPITSISFAHVPDFEPRDKEDSDFPNDATIPADKFVIRDFAVGTSVAVLAYVTSDGSTVDVIHRDHHAPVFALDAHPFEPKLAVGSYSGLLKVWDYELKECVISRYFERGQMIRCCAYDPKGEYIAVGFMNGNVRILDSITLRDELNQPYRYSRDVITHCAFSHDSKYLATADGEFTVTIFRASNQSEDGWEYMGRRRSHYKLIVDLLFTAHLDTNLPRLFTLGEDRMLVEYDLSESDMDDIVISNTDRIEQSCLSLCLTMYPSISKEQFILTANDHYKFKLYNSTTKMCRKTLLGPTYGSPIQKMLVLPTDNPHTDPRYLTYMTVDKVGISKVPLTGNPHNAMALIAHPAGVTNLVSSYDGQFIFTAGGSDSVVHMWNTNFSVLEAQAELGGEDLLPFYGLLDGGREGDLFAELEDYFYYAQIRSQGVNTMETRQVSTEIPLTEAVFVMRALGYYPSEQEVMDMMNEVKYGLYVETGQYVNNIDLATFIRLYINHRPAFGLDPEELSWLFTSLAAADGDEVDDGEVVMDRGYLLDLLQSRGEPMTEYELADYMTTLLGYNQEGGSCELHHFDPSISGDVISAVLPEDVSARTLADKLLGFRLDDDKSGALNVDDRSLFTP